MRFEIEKTVAYNVMWCYSKCFQMDVGSEKDQNIKVIAWLAIGEQINLLEK
jgi:hypothetical protein